MVAEQSARARAIVSLMLTVILEYEPMGTAQSESLSKVWPLLWRAWPWCRVQELGLGAQAMHCIMPTRETDLPARTPAPAVSIVPVPQPQGFPFPERQLPEERHEPPSQNY